MSVKELPELNKVLIITGMHRSGTSLVTQWLHTCGLHVGEELLSGSVSNQDGHFEDIEFLKMHEDILRDEGVLPSGLHADKSILPTEYQKSRMASVVAVKNRLYKQWGWKEPRTCLFLKSYKEILPSANYLIVFRDYQSVVGSLLKREFMPIDQKFLARDWFSRKAWIHYRRKRKIAKHYQEYAPKYLKAWIVYNQAILDLIINIPKNQSLVISYELLKNKSAEVFDFLTTKWDFELEYNGFLTIYKESLISNRINFINYVDDSALIMEANKLNDSFVHYLEQDFKKDNLL